MGDAILDRDLRVEWLDAALRVARKRLSLAEARTQLRDELVHEPLGAAALTKTVTALTRIWLAPSTTHLSHVQWALTHADRTADWRPLHLGALLVSEPFIRSLLDACGRELTARGEVDTVVLRDRMRRVYGPRRSIDISTQRGVKTLRGLGLLEGEPSASVSTRGCLSVAEGDLAAWLIRCLLLGRAAESIALDDLGHAPEFFAVKLPAVLPRRAAGVSKHTEGVGRTVMALDI